MVSWFGRSFWVIAPFVGPMCVGFGLCSFPPIGTNKLGDCDVLVGSHRQVRWPGSGGWVGRGNKFVLLDMTEEPEAKKAYSIQHKRNLMKR